jgi:hypothetical protein
VKFPIALTPLSLSEVHRRRAMRLSQFWVQPAALSAAECTQNEEDEEQQ